MSKTIAETGTWILKCRCGNEIKMLGERILELPAIPCGTCDRYPNIRLLQTAVGLLINFYKQLDEATKETEKYTWAKITPPSSQ